MFAIRNIALFASALQHGLAQATLAHSVNLSATAQTAEVTWKSQASRSALALREEEDETSLVNRGSSDASAIGFLVFVVIIIIWFLWQLVAGGEYGYIAFIVVLVIFFVYASGIPGIIAFEIRALCAWQRRQAAAAAADVVSM